MSNTFCVAEIMQSSRASGVGGVHISGKLRHRSDQRSAGWCFVTRLPQQSAYRERESALTIIKYRGLPVASLVVVEVVEGRSVISPA